MVTKDELVFDLESAPSSSASRGDIWTYNNCVYNLYLFKKTARIGLKKGKELRIACGSLASLFKLTKTRRLTYTTVIPTARIIVM